MKMLKILALTATLFLQSIESSIVIDRESQKSILLSDYCPKTKYCKEGTHVLCMYYNPNHIMGPRCSRPKNVSITPELAEKILEISNLIRSKIAQGKELGKGGNLLPKGFGISKLQWDSELATFAQVLANRCVLGHDQCRATKRFPDPGQTAGLVRFTDPDWIPISTPYYQFTKPGLTMSKLSWAMMQVVKSWYRQKLQVDADMINSYPDWLQSESSGGRLYLEMIHGGATHMGCGVSAYMEYAYHDNNAPLIYNSVQMICNFSSRPRKGSQVYEVNPPDIGYSARCGCPEGTVESEDCLCIVTDSQDITTPISERTCSDTGHCKPAVVLLPIFTVENAPPEKLLGRSGLHVTNKDEEEILDLYTDNNSTLHPLNNIQRTMNEVFGSVLNDGQRQHGNPISTISSHLPGKTTRLGYTFSKTEPLRVISNLVSEARRGLEHKISTQHHKPLDVQKRVYGKRSPTSLSYHSINAARPKKYIQTNRKSVFASVAKFQLPKTGDNFIKADVRPRKDFSDVQNLMQDYLSYKKDHTNPRNGFHKQDHFEHHSESIYLRTTTERFLNSAEEKVMKYNYYLRNMSEAQQFKNHAKRLFGFDNDSKEKSNDKLMSLLDKLEQEVKHIELDRNKKEIFDAKIRRIYGTVVGEPGLLTFKTDHEYDFTDDELTDFNKYESNRRHLDVEGKTHVNKAHGMADVEELEKNVEKIRDRYSDFENEIRPVTRSLNNLYTDKDQRHIKRTKVGYDSDHPSEADEIKANIRKSMYSTGNDIKNDEKDVLRRRSYYSNTDDDKKVAIAERRKLRDDKDPLGRDRRIYYQSKLDNLERKLHISRNVKHHTDSNNRQLRPVLPTREEQPIRASKSQPDPFYMPDRARFLHGF